VVVVSLRALHGRLLVVGFDRSSARQVGVSPAIVDAAVLVLLALTILVAVQGLGKPARRRRPRRPRGHGAGADAAHGADDGDVRRGSPSAAGIGGLYLSYYANTAAGASIAGLLVLAFLAAQAL